MEIERLEEPGYEGLWRATDPNTGFHSFIAIHSLRRGPALGGLRFWEYPDEATARQDVLRLAKAMTYKAAVAGIPHGGGKGIIIKPKGAYDRDLLLEKFGEFIESLNGNYITAKDVGTSSEDMAMIRRKTRYVTGLPESQGGTGSPSGLTAMGVFLGLRATVEEVLQTKSLAGQRIIVQGLGGVGAALVHHLKKAGADVWGTDIDPKTLFRLAQSEGLHPMIPEAVFQAQGLVFAPCALGQALNAKNIPGLKVKIVAGAANDPLTNPEQDADLLHQHGILYAPDFVINAGGLIHVAAEWAGLTPDQAKAKVERIPILLKKVYAMAKQGKYSTLRAAKQMAEENLAEEK